MGVSGPASFSRQQMSLPETKITTKFTRRKTISTWNDLSSENSSPNGFHPWTEQFRKVAPTKDDNSWQNVSGRRIADDLVLTVPCDVTRGANGGPPSVVMAQQMCMLEQTIWIRGRGFAATFFLLPASNWCWRRAKICWQDTLICEDGFHAPAHFGTKGAWKWN